MSWTDKLPTVLAVLALLLLSACSGNQEAAALLTNKLSNNQNKSTISYPRSAVQGRFATNGNGLRSNTRPSQHASRANVSRGTGVFTNQTGAIKTRNFYAADRTFSGQDGVTLNLLSVSIAAAAKIVLGDILKLNYVLSDKVVGRVTIQTTSPVSKDALIDIFETIMISNGATIVQSGELYRIVPTSTAQQTMASISRGQSGPGARLLIQPLRYVGAMEIKRIVTQTGSASALLRVDAARNIVLLRGTAAQLQNITELISVFDVDWMKGMSFAIYPVRTANPETIVKELETIFGLNKNGPLKGVVQFVPNKRLNGVLVMTSRPQYLSKAERWIVKLDKAAQRGEPQLFVYNVQNRQAKELAALLQKVLGRVVASGRDDAARTVAPKFAPTTVSRIGEQRSVEGPTIINREQTRLSSVRSSQQPVIRVEGRNALAIGTTSSGSLQHIKVVADIAKNSLLIMALPKDHERLLRILRRLDVVQTQVLLEAVIAEVSLNDELKFGLRWYFQKKRSSYEFSDAVSGAVSSVFPGFSYFFNTPNIQVALNAVAGITNVQVISAPSLMVLDNRTATLQVGDQVPITTQTAQSVANPGAPVINTVTLRDTGIILRVTPRVNDSGHVVLNIEQEVSNVVKTTSSGIDSPTIQQRKIKTTVVVNDGQVLALGGLIQERSNVTKTQVPLLGDIPYLGTVFRSKQDTIRRTELLIFIKPQVVRNADEARKVTDEFRSQINLRRPASKRGRNKLHRDFNRIAQ